MYVRFSACALMASALLACSSSSQVATSPASPSGLPSPTSSDCPSDNSFTVDIYLIESDNGRSITVHLCSVISVRLFDSQGIQSSDQAVLAILPLPLPAPPLGGAYDWFEAKRTGLADLSSEPRTAPCNAAFCHWKVHVTVVR